MPHYDVELEDSVGLSDSVSLSGRTSLVWPWAQIAVKHEEEALESRARRDLDEELRACMVCTAAAAFALDAIYAEQCEIVSEKDRKAWRDNRTARWKQIFETLRQAFNVSGSARDELKWLFEPRELGRDFLVHPDADFRDLAEHPLGPRMTAEHGQLRAENATRAVDLLMHILDASVTAKTGAATEWVRVNGGAIEQVRALRAERSA